MNFKSVKNIRTFIVLIGTIAAVSTYASDSPKECGEAISLANLIQIKDQLSNKPDSPTLGGSCSLAMSHYHLGALAVLEGDFALARHHYREMQPQNNKEKSLKKQLKLGIDYVAAESSGSVDRKKYISKFEKLLQTNPNSTSILAQLGSLYFDTKNYDKAINYWERSVSSRKNWQSYRNLTIAYHHKKQYEQSIQAFDQAYLLNTGLFADKRSMLALADSFFEVGRIKSAGSAIGKLAELNPKVIESDEFQSITQKIYNANPEYWDNSAHE